MSQLRLQIFVPMLLVLTTAVAGFTSMGWAESEQQVNPELLGVTVKAKTPAEKTR